MSDRDDVILLPEGGVSASEYERREAAYALMDKAVAPIGTRTVLIAFVEGSLNVHVSVRDPNATDTKQVLLTANQALYALALYIKGLQQHVAAEQAAPPAS